MDSNAWLGEWTAWLASCGWTACLEECRLYTPQFTRGQGRRRWHTDTLSHWHGTSVHIVYWRKKLLAGGSSHSHVRFVAWLPCIVAGLTQQEFVLSLLYKFIPLWNEQFCSLAVIGFSTMNPRCCNFGNSKTHGLIYWRGGGWPGTACTVGFSSHFTPVTACRNTATVCSASVTLSRPAFIHPREISMCKW